MPTETAVWRSSNGALVASELSARCWANGASLAWSLKAWAALLVPETPRHAQEHRAQKRTPLRMEFGTFCAAMIEMPCQIVRSGRRLVYRLLSWNPWQGVFLRLVERLNGCWLY